MSGAGIEAVLRFAEGCTGISFSTTQEEVAAGAVRRAMERAGVREAGAFLQLVTSDAEACDLLLEELAVGETYFFREQEQLAFIRDHVLPELRPRGGIRCWSAACATGEEAYTLSMLLLDAGCRGSRVLGTDVVRGRLVVAANATYGRWSLRGVSPATVDRLFEREDTRFRVRPEARAGVEFRPLNLADAQPAYTAAGAWGMDLVLCRNVLIYLDRDTVRHVAARLLESLAPDGWLFLGAADPALAELVPCEVVATGAGVAYRKPRRVSFVPLPAETPPRTPAPRSSGDSDDTDGSVGALPAYGPASSPPADVPEDPGARAARVRDLADRGRLEEAGVVCAAALDLDPHSPELLYLHAMLLLAARRFMDAADAARRALYLDRGLVVAHLALGSALAGAGDSAGAARAFRNAAGLLRSLGADDVVPASGGETAGRLLAVAESQLRVLGEVA